jgi:hypothetical protein
VARSTYADPRVRKLLEPRPEPTPGESITVFRYQGTLGSGCLVTSFREPPLASLVDTIIAPLGSCLDASKRFLILPASHRGRWWFDAESAWRAAAIHSCGLRLAP